MKSGGRAVIGVPSNEANNAANQANQAINPRRRCRPMINSLSSLQINLNVRASSKVSTPAQPFSQIINVIKTFDNLNIRKK